MNEVSSSYTRQYKEPSFPFDKSVFDTPLPAKKKARKTRPPRVTAGGHLIRDAPETFQVVPNFEDLLKSLQNNKAEIALPVRTVFVGAQMLATQALVAQPGVLGRSALSPDQAGPPGPPGLTGATGSTGPTGATGAAGTPAVPPTPPPGGGSASSDDPMGSVSQQASQLAPGANVLAQLPGPPPPQTTVSTPWPLQLLT